MDATAVSDGAAVFVKRCDWGKKKVDINGRKVYNEYITIEVKQYPRLWNAVLINRSKIIIKQQATKEFWRFAFLMRKYWEERQKTEAPAT